MKSSYTPSPWTAETDGVSGVYWILSKAHGDNAIATVHGKDDIEEMKTLECSSNAYLISAAPDMLDALERIVRAFTYASVGPDSIKQARDAIAKATGKQ